VLLRLLGDLNATFGKQFGSLKQLQQSRTATAI
jgi:hypothetical protein